MEGIGNILYSVISEIGKEKIQSDITLNIELLRRYILRISERCKKIVNLGNEEYIESPKLWQISVFLERPKKLTIASKLIQCFCPTLIVAFNRKVSLFFS